MSKTLTAARLGAWLDLVQAIRQGHSVHLKGLHAEIREAWLDALDAESREALRNELAEAKKSLG